MESVSNKLTDDALRKIIDEKYADLDLDDRKDLYEYYTTYDDELLKKQIKKYIFIKDPPTPEEFLNWRTGWLPKKVAESVYPHVKEDFINILNKKENYFQIVQYGATRLGKSFLARMLVIYTIIYIHHLREPNLYYGLSPLSNLAIYFISFKFDKTKQLYLKHIFNYLENAPRFIKTIYQDKVRVEQQKYGVDKIVWSKASLVGEITLSSGLQIILGNDNPNEIIGADIIQVYVSEISFFIEEAGATEESIYRLYTDAYDRIEATVGNEYLAYLYLDSSANYADSLIEKKIIRELQFQEFVYFRWRKRWDSPIHKFPKYRKGIQELIDEGFDIKDQDKFQEELCDRGYTFKVITGDAAIPATIVKQERQLKDVPKDLILYVPIDAKKQFEDNLVQSIKNLGGCPTSKEYKFIQNENTIDDIWDDLLINVEGGIIADTADPPEQLIWNQVVGKFFIQSDKRFYIYRAPLEPRFLAIDTAYSANGDIYGVTLLHLETLKEGNKKIAVVDFSFPILPGKEGINLTAVELFIKDLIELGGISLYEINSDTFQSQQTLQNLKRMGLEIKKQSVDRTIEPYQRLLSCIIQRQIKSGKNIYLKNNLRSLERIRNDKGKEKIDHSAGETNNKYHGDWKNSTAGKNAKDVSDTLASTVYSAFNSDILPVTYYEEENMRFSKEEEDQSFFKNQAIKNMQKNKSIIASFR